MNKPDGGDFQHTSRLETFAFARVFLLRNLIIGSRDTSRSTGSPSLPRRMKDRTRPPSDGFPTPDVSLLTKRQFRRRTTGGEKSDELGSTQTSKRTATGWVVALTAIGSLMA